MALLIDQSGLAMNPGRHAPASLDLTGDGWILHEAGKRESLPATVPGSTYTNLLAANRIPDPSYRENNGQVQWVGERAWCFERSFHVPEEVHAREQVELVCHGLDTLATVRLNGHKVGVANNMFRTWSFDIRRYLHTGTNHLEIRFDPLTGYVEEQRRQYRQKYQIDLSNERSWVRKAPYMWGWDWCRPVLTQGIWRKIEVRAYETRIADVGVVQRHQTDGTVQLEIQTELAGRLSGLRVEAEVAVAGEVVATAAGAAHADTATLPMVVREPQLWWPNGMGDQPLYTVTVSLKDGGGNCLDMATRRIGLRTVEVVPPSQEIALHLRVNGVPVFARGADWIPADNLPTRVTPEILRWYMSKAADSNFNFIRLWGGGYYEEDELFDLCDELGLMVQFEFKFANASYPVRDAEWMSNLREEIEQQTRRCRNHASIVIWSGNNEIEYFEGYNELFGDCIGGIVHRLVPGAFYEVGSGAHGSGDIHFWDVWHGDKPVESFLQVEGFVTEFGMQSTPVPATVRSYTDASDRQSLLSPVMRYHELDGSGHGMEIIQRYTEENFGRVPENFEDALWLTNLNQAWMVRYAVEHWRRQMPRSMAAVIWQYNDCWPCSTWSMVDYFRREKPLLHQARHFFAPVMVSGLPDAGSGLADIVITSDQQNDWAGALRWSVSSGSGEILREGEKQVNVHARSSQRAESLELADLIKAYGAANLLIWAEVVVEGRRVAQNTLFFGRPKVLRLRKPDLQVRVSGGETEYSVTVETDVPALWVWAEMQDMDASYSDNFLHVRHGQAAEIDIVVGKPVSPYEFRRRLRVRSVFDVAPEMRA